MKYGTINCACGQQFYFESNATNITCIKCDQAHDISGYPELVVVEPIEEPIKMEVEGE